MKINNIWSVDNNNTKWTQRSILTIAYISSYKEADTTETDTFGVVLITTIFITTEDK